eukprot:746910-Hanusia_phi.AAC.2
MEQGRLGKESRHAEDKEGAGGKRKNLDECFIFCGRDDIVQAVAAGEVFQQILDPLGVLEVKVVIPVRRLRRCNNRVGDETETVMEITITI